MHNTITCFFNFFFLDSGSGEETGGTGAKGTQETADWLSELIELSMSLLMIHIIR